jgi:hypothetical protein
MNQTNQWTDLEAERTLIRAQKLWRRRKQCSMDRRQRQRHAETDGRHVLAGAQR